MDDYIIIISYISIIIRDSHFGGQGEPFAPHDFWKKLLYMYVLAFDAIFFNFFSCWKNPINFAPPLQNPEMTFLIIIL